MPSYEYLCECGLLFEKSVRFANKDQPATCKSCGAKASRKMPSDVQGVFAHQTQGPGPQNTGVSNLDHHVDRVIGRSADDGWEFQDKREAVKRQILRANPGATKQDLTELPDGTWDVMDPMTRTQQASARIIHNAAMRQGKYTNHDTYHLDDAGNNQAMSGQKRRTRKRSLPSGSRR